MSNEVDELNHREISMVDDDVDQDMGCKDRSQN